MLEGMALMAEICPDIDFMACFEIRCVEWPVHCRRYQFAWRAENKWHLDWRDWRGLLSAGM